MRDHPLLSKSTFLSGVQCQKALALSAFQPALRTTLSTADQFRLQQGQIVGLEARQRYPGGAVGRVPDSYQLSIERTQALIDEGAPVIYEGAFEAAGVRVVTDILAKSGGGWRLIEVKSSSRAKPEHLWDVAVQVYTLREAGLTIEDAVLLHLDTNYVRQGPLDYQYLFAETPMLDEVEALLPEVERWIAISQETLAAGVVPDVPIGPQCTDPVTCDFKDYCWQGVPSPSVFDVYFIGKKAYELYDQGIERIDDIPAECPLDKRSQFHIQAHKAGEVIVKQDQLQDFLGGLCWPLYYLDFETFAMAIPPFDDLSPYGKVPFQYSLHVQTEPGGTLAHSGFLAPEGEDPRPEFLSRLLEDTQGQGSIIVYHLPFERGVLQSLAEWSPEHGPEIEGLISRLVDLLAPFRQRAYWNPGMGGSNSLKVVLPVFAPDLSYQEMEVGDGETAMVAYLGLASEKEPQRVESVKKALWEYCHLDTLAMVRILDGLRALV